ncbi:MAG: hypothetical protein ACRD18_01850 [Terriglobia bacterium]
MPSIRCVPILLDQEDGSVIDDWRDSATRPLAAAEVCLQVVRRHSRESGNPNKWTPAFAGATIKAEFGQPIEDYKLW